MKAIVEKIVSIYERRGNEKYADEEVTQLQHALHCAKLALDEQAPPPMVVAAFLHDIGHILGQDALPAGVEQDLHDHHEETGFAFLTQHFSPVIADPVRLHVAAKRWLCTTDPDYAQRLSPTSYKSYLDQGGRMSDEERRQFEAHPNFAAAVQVRRWDDQGKNPQEVLPSLQELVPLIEAQAA
jgi:predicted HD phosphohydrolase